MAFGDYKGGDKVSLTSVTNPTTVPTGFYCAGGWLAVVSTGTATGLTAGACTDTVSGNTFTPFNNGLDVGPAWRGYYSIITNPGIVKPSVAFTGSTQDVCVILAAFEGPFSKTAQLDGNPAMLSDASTPFVSNLSGTLAQANELVVTCFIQALSATTATATSPNVFRDQQNSAAQGTAGSLTLAIGSWVVAVNTSITATWTSSAGPTGAGVHIATFKKDPATDTLMAQGSA